MTVLSRLRPWRLGHRPARCGLHDAFSVLDVDLTGIDVSRDRVTGIAAVRFQHAGFRLQDLEYVAVEGSCDDDRAGCVKALIDGGPVVTFNPDFVRHMLQRALPPSRWPTGDLEWIDLRHLLEGAFGRDSGQPGAVDTWAARFDIEIRRRHSAVCDVFAMAQLMERVIAEADCMGTQTFSDLLDLRRRGAARYFGD